VALLHREMVEGKAAQREGANADRATRQERTRAKNATNDNDASCQTPRPTAPTMFYFSLGCKFIQIYINEI
jgi:hypothetical protein